MGDTKLLKLHDKYKEELEGMYKEGPVESAKVPMVKDLAKAVYYLGKICEDCEMEEGYSQNGNSYRGRSRESMGRYSGSPYSGNRSWPMSYDDAKFNMVHKLGDLMMCTENEHTKSVLRNAINQIENG